MDDYRYKTPLQLSGSTVIVPIRYDLTRPLLAALKDDLMNFITQQSANMVVFDLKGIEIIDSNDFQEFIRLTRIIKVMGLKSIVCGLSPGAIAAIIALNIDTDRLDIRQNLSEVLLTLNNTSEDDYWDDSYEDLFDGIDLEEDQNNDASNV